MYFLLYSIVNLTFHKHYTNITPYSCTHLDMIGEMLIKFTIKLVKLWLTKLVDI